MKSALPELLVCESDSDSDASLVSPRRLEIDINAECEPFVDIAESNRPPLTDAATTSGAEQGHSSDSTVTYGVELMNSGTGSTGSSDEGRPPAGSDAISPSLADLLDEPTSNRPTSTERPRGFRRASVRACVSVGLVIDTGAS